MVVPPLLLPSQHSQPFLTMDAPLDRARLFTRVTLWQPSLNVGLILAIIQVGSMVSDLARLDVHSQCKSLRRCGSRGEATEGLTRCLDLKQMWKNTHNRTTGPPPSPRHITEPDCDLIWMVAHTCASDNPFAVFAEVIIHWIPKPCPLVHDRHDLPHNPRHLSISYPLP